MGKKHTKLCENCPVCVKCGIFLVKCRGQERQWKRTIRGSTLRETHPGWGGGRTSSQWWATTYSHYFFPLLDHYLFSLLGHRRTFLPNHTTTAAAPLLDYRKEYALSHFWDMKSKYEMWNISKDRCMFLPYHCTTASPPPLAQMKTCKIKS